MGIYLGSSNKLKLTIANNNYNFKIPDISPILEGIKLKTLDDYILKSSNGFILTAKESE